MDIFQNQCSLGFDSMLASNPINSPLQGTDSLNFNSSPYFTTIPSDQPTTTTTMTGANDVVLPSIFVKVPMQINQQYQQQNQNQHQQTADRSRNSQEVIKCEDKSIKRELGDLRALEKGTAMVQLPSGAAQSYLGEDHQEAGDDGGNAELRVFCCELCPFVTVQEQNMGEHRQGRHPNEERDVVEWVSCPACENKFRQRRSLESHLLEDHMMDRSEVQLLLDRRFPSDSVNNVACSQSVTPVSETQPMQAIPEQNKSRIYIKNVQLLKKPDVIEQENVQQESEDQQQQQNRKIFIRNVSLLQNANFMQNSVDFSAPSGLHESKYSFVVPAPSPNSESPPITEPNTTPQRSKIFIRNVDILRNPLLPIPLPPVIASTCEMSRASSSESLYTTPPPPPVISPATSISSIGPPTTGGLNMLILPSSNSNTPPTTCTPPAIISTTNPSDYSQSPQTAPRKSKIFIKNISVLKQPTIHLKSVDELNLMTIDQLQLQNLLPPVVTNGNSSSQNLDTLANDHHQTSSSSSSPMDDEDFGGLLDVETPSELAEDFECTADGGQYQDAMQGCESVTCDENGGVVSNGMVQGQQQQHQDDLYQQQQHNQQQQQQFDSDFIIIEPGSSSTEDIHYEGAPVEQMRLSLQPTDMMDHHLQHTTSSSNLHQLQAPLPPPPQLPLEPLPAPIPTQSQYTNSAAGQTDEDILFVCAEEIINLDPIPHMPSQQQQQQHQQLEPLDQQPVQQQLPQQQQGRIYVSENLMEPVAPPPPQPQVVCVPPAPPPPSPTTPTPIESGSAVNDQQQQQQQLDKDGRTRSRGRPKGAKQTGITKLKKLYTNLTPLEEGYKCDLVDCGARFRQMETLAYHKRCHYEGGGASQQQQIRCPECGSLEFRNWNTLHTHLWREHSIDMELYSCHLCNFKTPVLCRLNNTHMKIHSEEKNFVCVICDKRFKNNKQLRNHRRSHRDQQQVPQPRPQPPPREPTPERSGTNPVKCVKCGLKFPNQKALKSHVELKHFLEAATATTSTGTADGPRLRCSLCSMVFKTRYLLQSHVAKHSDEKRFSCENCDYSTNDHNAIRRHKMRHNSSGHMYRCSYCDYTSIQSTTYRKHLERMHADVASALLYKCSRCTFVSISEVKYQLHRSKHESDDQQQQQQQQQPEEMPPSEPPPPEQERQCESVNSDVVIVEGGRPTAEDGGDPEEEQPPLDAFSLIAAGAGAISNQPMIRPAGFAHNLSKVDNFYGYPAAVGEQHYAQQQQQQQQQEGCIDGQQQQQMGIAGAEENRGGPGIMHDGMDAMGYGEG